MPAKRTTRRNMWPFGTNQPLGPTVYHAKRTRAAAGGSGRPRPVSAKATAKAERESEAQRRGRKLSDPNLESKLKSWYAKGGNLNEFLQANPSYRKYFDEDSEGKSKVYRGYQIWPVRDGWKTSLSVLPTFASEAAAKKFLDAQLAKKNPAEAAAEVYEEFHGMPSSEIVEVTRKVHYHKHLSALGRAEALVVLGLDGYERRLVGFKGAKLCCNERKNQLFMEGGDQALDPGEWGFKKDWPHEINSLGLVTRIEYFTTKTHLGSEGGTAIYFHEPGKAERGQSAGVGPDLIYDAPNEALLFAGGTYLIKREGIDK
jgi:hypothetical protein